MKINDNQTTMGKIFIKGIWALCLVLILIATPVTSCYAENPFAGLLPPSSVDYSVFESVEGLTHTYDDMTDTHKVESTVDLASLVVDQKAAVSPLIVGLSAKSAQELVFLVRLVSIDPNRYIGLKSFIVKTDSNRYTGDLANVEKSEGYTNYVESGQIICGENALAMISDMVTSGEVKVRLIGEKKNVDFVMNKTQIKVLKTLHDAYLASGADKLDLSFSNLLDSVEKH